MSLSPVEIAIAAYDAKLNEQLGNPTGYALGPDARSDLRESPMIVAMLAAHEKAVREQIVHDMTACTKCGKPHVYRDLPPTGQYVRGTWADPADGHSYYPRINNGTLASESIAVVLGEVSS